MPFDARPQARSRSGLLGPMVSSRSWGPEPATSTTAGNGPAPAGIERVPGRDQGAAPTVTSVSVNADGSTYAAGDASSEASSDGDGEFAGSGDPATGSPRWRPATWPSPVTVTRSGTVAFANRARTVART